MPVCCQSYDIVVSIGKMSKILVWCKTLVTTTNSVTRILFFVNTDNIVNEELYRDQT